MKKSTNINSRTLRFQKKTHSYVEQNFPMLMKPISSSKQELFDHGKLSQNSQNVKFDSSIVGDDIEAKKGL